MAKDDGFQWFMASITSFPDGPIYIPGVAHQDAVVRQFGLTDGEWHELGTWITQVNNLVANLKNPKTNRTHQTAMMELGAPGNQSHRILWALYAFFGDGMESKEAESKKKKGK